MRLSWIEARRKLFRLSPLSLAAMLNLNVLELVIFPRACIPLHFHKLPHQTPLESPVLMQ